MLPIIVPNWNRSQPDKCKAYCDEEELEAIEHFLCRFGGLRLRILGMASFESLNSVSRADIKAFYMFITNLGWLKSVRASLV